MCSNTRHVEALFSYGCRAGWGPQCDDQSLNKTHVFTSRLDVCMSPGLFSNPLIYWYFLIFQIISSSTWVCVCLKVVQIVGFPLEIGDGLLSTLLAFTFRWHGRRITPRYRIRVCLFFGRHSHAFELKGFVFVA